MRNKHMLEGKEVKAGDLLWAFIGNREEQTKVTETTPSFIWVENLGGWDSASTFTGPDCFVSWDKEGLRLVRENRDKYFAFKNEISDILESLKKMEQDSLEAVFPKLQKYLDEMKNICKEKI